MIETFIFTFGCVIGLSLGIYFGHKSGYSKGFTIALSESRTQNLLDNFADWISKQTPMHPKKFSYTVKVQAPNPLFEPEWNKYILEAARLNCRQKIIEQLDQADILTAYVQEQPDIDLGQELSKPPRKMTYIFTLSVLAAKDQPTLYEKPEILTSISSNAGCQQHK